MFSALISAALANLLWLALHIEGNGSFPKPLTPAQERDCFARKEQGDPSARDRKSVV